MLNVGDTVIINELAAKGLPMRVGARAVIIDKIYSPNFQFVVEFDDGETSPIKGVELNDLTDELSGYMDFIFTGNKVTDERTGEIVEITKANYLTKQADIRDKNMIESIAGFNSLQPIHIDSIEELPVSNSEIYQKLLQEKHDVYVRKNADYGNSFEDQFNEYGLLSAIIRLDDKLRRLKQLRNSEAKVKDESIRDTALDLANYADMLVMILDKSSK